MTLRHTGGLLGFMLDYRGCWTIGVGFTYCREKVNLIPILSYLWVRRCQPDTTDSCASLCRISSLQDGVVLLEVRKPHRLGYLPKDRQLPVRTLPIKTII